jgi:hypothetical protein
LISDAQSSTHKGKKYEKRRQCDSPKFNNVAVTHKNDFAMNEISNNLKFVVRLSTQLKRKKRKA